MLRGSFQTFARKGWRFPAVTHGHEVYPQPIKPGELRVHAYPARCLSSMIDPLRSTTVIEPTSGWKCIDTRELYRYRDLIRFLCWRQIKVLYAQSALGIGWAVLQPLLTLVVFAVVFGKWTRVDSHGVPYHLFAFCAIVPWTYFANSILESGNSLVTQADMISKVYFPRVILPLSSVLAKLLDFAIAFLILVLLLWVQGYPPTIRLLALPIFFSVMVITALGIGLWLTTLAVKYRDFKHAMGFLVQLGMFASPVAYSTSAVPESWQPWYALNPMVCVIEGFRAVLLGSTEIPWGLLAIGSFSAVTLLISGLLYFRRQERLFADLA
jgi:lipopolysaccharide transport system permease protein